MYNLERVPPDIQSVYHLTFRACKDDSERARFRACTIQSLQSVHDSERVPPDIQSVYGKQKQHREFKGTQAKHTATLFYQLDKIEIGHRQNKQHRTHRNRHRIGHTEIIHRQNTQLPCFNQLDKIF